MALNNYGPEDIQFISVNLTTSGDLKAAVPNRKIRVISYALVASAAFTCTFNSGTGPTAKSGPMSLAANGGVSFAGGVTAPAFETGTGEKLTLTLSGSGTVAGHVAYVLV